jgi:hypothetical protein
VGVGSCPSPIFGKKLLWELFKRQKKDRRKQLAIDDNDDDNSHFFQENSATNNASVKKSQKGMAEISMLTVNEVVKIVNPNGDDHKDTEENPLTTAAANAGNGATTAEVRAPTLDSRKTKKRKEKDSANPFALSNNRMGNIETFCHDNGGEIRKPRTLIVVNTVNAPFHPGTVVPERKSWPVPYQHHKAPSLPPPPAAHSASTTNTTPTTLLLAYNAVQQQSNSRQSTQRGTSSWHGLRNCHLPPLESKHASTRCGAEFQGTEKESGSCCSQFIPALGRVFVP